MNLADFEIKILSQSDLEVFHQHMKLCIGENGLDQPIFSPRDSVVAFEEFSTDYIKEFSVADNLKKRVELLIFHKNNQEIAGHISLSFSGMPSHKHRRYLGIAILKKYQGIGLGKFAMEHCFEWCRNYSVEYIDLGVFETNQRAFELYKKLGFLQMGRTEDLFRIRGQRLTDIQMYKKL